MHFSSDIFRCKNRLIAVGNADIRQLLGKLFLQAAISQKRLPFTDCRPRRRQQGIHIRVAVADIIQAAARAEKRR